MSFDTSTNPDTPGADGPARAHLRGFLAAGRRARTLRWPSPWNGVAASTARIAARIARILVERGLRNGSPPKTTDDTSTVRRIDLGRAHAARTSPPRQPSLCRRVF